MVVVQVGPQPLLQIFLFCGAVEFASHKGKLTFLDMFEDGREPGNFGFVSGTTQPPLPSHHGSLLREAYLDGMC